MQDNKCHRRKLGKRWRRDVRAGKSPCLPRLLQTLTDPELIIASAEIGSAGEGSCKHRASQTHSNGGTSAVALIRVASGRRSSSGCMSLSRRPPILPHDRNFPTRIDKLAPRDLTIQLEAILYRRSICSIICSSEKCFFHP